MKKILLLLVGAIVAFAVNADVTIRFQDTGNWGSVNIWPWTAAQGGGQWLENNGYKNGDSQYSFPGPAMTKNETNGYYEITFPTAPEKIIFKGPNQQSPEFNYAAGKVFTASGSFDYEENYKDFYLRGNFSNWNAEEGYKFSTEDGVTYTYVAEKELKSDGVSGQATGFKINDGSNLWFGVSGAFVIGSPFNLSSDGGAGNIVGDIPAGATVTFTYNASGTSTLLIEKAVVDVYTFALYTGTTKLMDFPEENPYEVTYNISTPLASDMPLVVKRAKNGTVDTTYGLSTALTYDGTNGGEKALQADGAAVVLQEALQGAVKFVLSVAGNVPSSLNISGGSLYQGGGDDDGDYTIYFYDQNNVVVNGAIYAHIWNSNADFKPWGANEAVKMTNTGKYIRRVVNGEEKYYPLYSLSFSWDQTPETIIIWNGDTSYIKRFTGGSEGHAVFHNNGYYTNGATSAEIGLQPVEIGDRYLYMHFKEDMIFEAQDGEKGAAYCNVMNGNTYIGGLVRDDAHKMELFNDKYMIYRYKLTPEEIANGNNVEFSFKLKDSNDYRTFRASNAGESRFNQKRWMEFIYATANENNATYAVQSYLSWEKFRELDAKGRPSIYLVGQGAIKHEGNDLGWNPATAAEFVNQDGSCFYIPVTITGQVNTIFKMSWINVAEVKKDATEAFRAEARDWATYDLGIVGVAARYPYPAGSYSPDIHDGSDYEQGIRCTKFDVNTSVKYLNYNQYNWVINGPNLTPGDYYIVIDTHDTCRTVTFVDFNPNPSVVVSDTEISKVDLTPEQAISLHRHYNHLSMASHNGHIAMDKVNTCSGTLAIGGSKGLDINNSGFDIEYSVAMNGDQVVSHRGKPGRIHLDYMPFGTANDIEVRAMYTDIDHDGRKGTGLTFHSRRGSASVEVPAEMPLPYAKINNSQYVRYLEEEPFGVLLDDIEFECVTDYNVYGDLTFTFDVPDADTSRRVEIMHSGHELASKITVSTLSGWTPLVLSDDNDFANYDFEGGSNNWSSLIIKEGVNVPVLLNKYTDKFSKDLLEDKTVEGLAHAIYPFIYETNPSFEIIPEETNGGNSAPRKAVSVASLPSDLAGFAISHFDRSYPISIDVAASNAISGIENVAVEAAADAEAEYFTISGIRVEGTPEPGIYLRRAGDKVSKVVVR